MGVGVGSKDPTPLSISETLNADVADAADLAETTVISKRFTVVSASVCGISDICVQNCNASDFTMSRGS